VESSCEFGIEPSGSIKCWGNYRASKDLSRVVKITTKISYVFQNKYPKSFSVCVPILGNVPFLYVGGDDCISWLKDNKDIRYSAAYLITSERMTEFQTLPQIRPWTFGPN
jgi:hypothetical protein